MRLRELRAADLHLLDLHVDATLQFPQFAAVHADEIQITLGRRVRFPPQFVEKPFARFIDRRVDLDANLGDRRPTDLLLRLRFGAELERS